MRTTIVVLLGLWLAFSTLMNAFGFWLCKAEGWNESRTFWWVLGFPLVALIGAGCGAYGIIKPRGYPLLVGLLMYAGAWGGLAIEKWRVSNLIVSAVNFLAILLAAKALNRLKAWR